MKISQNVNMLLKNFGNQKDMNAKQPKLVWGFSLFNLNRHVSTYI